MFSYKRSDRLGDQLKMEIADILFRKVKDSRIGFVTVTSVEVSEDLRHARVFVSILEEGPQEGKTLEGLNSASGFIRSELGKRLRLKFLPRLSFYQDFSARRAARVMELLDKIKKTDDDS